VSQNRSGHGAITGTQILVLQSLASHFSHRFTPLFNATLPITKIIYQHRASNPASIKTLNATETSAAEVVEAVCSSENEED
jgi:hypothetical protein